MAKIGLAKPYYAIYRKQNDTISYLPGGVLGKYTEISIELDDADDNILSAGNASAETDNRFSGGTATISTDDLDPAVLAPVLGIGSEPITLPGLLTENPAWIIFDENQKLPYIGLGGIVKKQVDNQIVYQAFALPKIQLNNPNLAVTTEGETIEWQTPELTAQILRSDIAGHRWFMLSDNLESEADAELALSGYLNSMGAFIPIDSPGGLITADGKQFMVVTSGRPATW